MIEAIPWPASMKLGTAAKYIDRDKRFILKLIESNKIIGYREGDLWKIDKGSLDLYIQKMRIETEEKNANKEA